MTLFLPEPGAAGPTVPGGAEAGSGRRAAQLQAGTVNEGHQRPPFAGWGSGRRAAEGLLRNTDTAGPRSPDPGLSVQVPGFPLTNLTSSRILF